MTTGDSARSIYKDAWVQTPYGRLFARTWSTPREEKAAERAAPIVLFHDSLGCIDLWRNFPARLCEGTGRRVIAYDRLGYGQSDPHQHGWPLDFIREESEIYFPALRQQLDFNDFVAFGHSVGGGMAVLCAAKFTDSCRALITESAQAFVEDRTLQGIHAAKKDFQGDGQLDRLKKYHGPKAEWVLNAWTETWIAPEFALWSLAADLPGVKCRVLAIHGDHDEYGSTRHPEMIGTLVSGPSQVEILSACRHVPHREREEKVVSLVATFLGGT